jgi:hypothetical protein
VGKVCQAVTQAISSVSLQERITMFKQMVLVIFGAIVAASASVAQEPGRDASKLDLTPQTFAKLHSLIRPHDNEWRHLKVEWLTDVVAARKRAAAEDKPIVICYTGGAGYNEPLGVC